MEAIENLSEDQRTLLLNRVRAERCRRSLLEFVRTFWSTVEPQPLVEAWYLEAICEHMQALGNRQITNLICNVPPGFGKSLLAVMFSAWLWTVDPTTRIIASSYSMNLSARDNLRCRRIIESQLYKSLFPEVQLSLDQGAKLRFELTAGGYRIATSLESANLGERCECLIVDDANDLSQVTSQSHMEAVQEWFTTILSTRLNNSRTGLRLIIQQRCAENDLSGYIIANDTGNRWCKLVLPLEWQGNSSPTLIGWTDPRKEIGEVMTGRIDPADIPVKRAEMGSLKYSALYLQNPLPLDGQHFKAKWFRYCQETPEAYLCPDKSVAKKDCTYFATVDLAISLKSSADYTAIAIVAQTPDNDMILAHLVRARIEGTRIVPTLQELAKQYPLRYFAIEQVAYQLLLIQQARKAGLTVRGIVPQGDKLSRSIPLQVRMEAGQVYFKDNLPNLDILQQELLGFPHTSHDDCFVKGTRIATARGEISIEDIRAGDLVWTRQGLRPVAKTWKKTRQTIRVTFSDGRTLQGTPSHPVWVENKGWLPLCSLTSLTMIKVWNQSQLNTMGGHTAAILTPLVDNIESTSNATTNGRRLPATCIGTFSKTLTDLLRKATLFITRTATRLTTVQTISKALPSMNTFTSIKTLGTMKPCEPTLTRLDHLQPSGISPKPGESGTRNTQRKTGKAKSQEPLLACSVETSSQPTSQAVQSSVLTIARKGIDGTQAKTTLNDSAAYADKALLLTKPLTLQPALISVVEVCEASSEPVYNLTVADPPEYFANGVLVHNCLDVCSMAANQISRQERPTKEKAPDLTPEERQAKYDKRRLELFWED